MVAPNKTRRMVCLVVRVSEEPEAPSRRLATRPSQLLPWADPYIAGLVRRMQSEVRFQRAGLAAAPTADEDSQWSQLDSRGAYRPTNRLQAELEPPSPAFDTDWDWSDRPTWTVDGEPVE